MNERGYAYPIVLMCCFVIAAIVLFHVQQYETDKQLLHEQIQHMKLESLLHLVYADVNKLLVEEGELNRNLIFSYEGGKVTLTFRAENGQLQQYTVIAQLDSGEIRRAWIYIDHDGKRIERYEEGTMGGI